MSPFKKKSASEIFIEVVGFLALTLVFIAMSIDAAYATGSNRDYADADARADAEANAHAGAEASADVANNLTVETAAAGGAANNEGNNLSVNSNYEGGPADLVLVPNNNTERCLRVFGFAFGNDEGSAMFGIPWRAKNCDYKGFASDADAQGNLELGWFWRCHMKSAYRVFRAKGESADDAIGNCHDHMIGRVELLARVNELEDRLEFERNERAIERDNASASRERIETACEESKDRILAGCVNK